VIGWDQVVGQNIPSVWLEAWYLLRANNPLGLFFSFIVGSALGSFSNVVIWRQPQGQSIVKPKSHCPHCKKPIPIKHNIPILSYFFLRGKTACCGESIAPRYPIVELIAAMVLGSLYLLSGWTLVFVFQSAFMILLLILSGIDLDHYRLPNALVATGAIISLLWMIFAPQQSWVDAGLGLVVGLAFGFLVMLVGKILKGQWSGMGDLKLSMVLGFAFGPERFVFLYLVAALAAVVYFIAKHNKISDRRVPMGPFFAIGAWVTIWIGSEVVYWYLNFWG
jgi:leader peptidase (prepilin peptidase)/N-methyltransferase